MSSTEFAAKIGVTTRTLARWHASGVLVPAFVLPSGERRYTEEQLDSLRGFPLGHFKKRLRELHKAERAARAAWRAMPPDSGREGHDAWVETVDLVMGLLESHGDAGWRVAEAMGIKFQDDDYCDCEVCRG